MYWSSFTPHLLHSVFVTCNQPPLSPELTMSDLVDVDVGSYGKVRGFAKGNVTEFRGIPFATIPARFRRAEIISSLPEGIVDATKYGPFPAQPPEDRPALISYFGEHIKTFFAEDASRTMSEDDCLNLNIVTPKNAIGTKKLPVLVWIYGILSVKVRAKK